MEYDFLQFLSASFSFFFFLLLVFFLFFFFFFFFFLFFFFFFFFFFFERWMETPVILTKAAVFRRAYGSPKSLSLRERCLLAMFLA